MNTITIPNSTTFLMITLALFNTIIPIIVAYYYKKKFDVKISTFFIGLLTYMLFAMLLIQIPDVLIRGGIKPFSDFIQSTPVAAAVYFTLITVLMEEFGRLFLYKTMMKKRMSKNESLMMGLGHGGIQAMFIGTSVMMSNAILAFAINAFGAEEYIKKLNLTGEKLETTKKGIVEFSQIPALQHFFDGSIPLLLIAAQIALSYIVYRSITDKTKKYLFPLAIGMHFLVLLPIYLVRKAVIQNMFVSELVILLITVGISYFAFRMYHEEN